MDPTIRPARPDDAPAVESFASDTWPEHGGDYVPRVFESWVEEMAGGEGVDRDSLTVVAEVDGRAVGLHRTVLLSADEAWCSGMRVDPAFRGEGIAGRLAEASFDWASERGASVARAMVFSWNAAGLAAARAVGFDPAVEFRWAHPRPDGGEGAAGPDLAAARPYPSAAWRFWEGSRTLEALDGLALDPNEPWALSSLTRERFVEADDDGRLLAIGDGGEHVHGIEVDGIRGLAIRVRVSERPSEGDSDGGDADVVRSAEYGVADWTDAEAAASVLDAVATDAASVDADRTRVLIPETPRAVSDAALAGVEVAESPDFVLAADLTDR